MPGLLFASRRSTYAVPAAILAAGMLFFVWQAALFNGHKSVTFDETIYTALSQESLARRSPDERLARMGVAPLPVWLAHVPANWHRPALRPAPLRGVPDDAAAVRVARRYAAAFGSLLLLGSLTVWLARSGGAWAAGGALLAAMSPSFIAHGTLATTDMAAAWSLTLLAACTAYGLAVPNRQRLLCFGVAWGLALSCKYTAVLGAIPAVVLSIRFVSGAGDGRRSGLLGGVAAFTFQGTMAFAVAWACHGGAWGSATLGGMKLGTVPAPMAGILSQWEHQQRGHAGYLLGHVHTYGWWYYFPVAAFCKSTPVELPLLGGALWMSTRSIGSPIIRFFRRIAPFIGRAVRDQPALGRAKPDGTRELAIALWIVMLWLAMIGSRVNIGHRYLLPLYPLSIVMTVPRLLQWQWGKVLLVALIGAQAISALAQSPHHLAYFSPLVGGSRHGHRWLGDSNLDWGQDLPALRAWWETNAKPDTELVYFGTADPRGEGIDWLGGREEEGDRLRRADYLAVSVTCLQRIYPTAAEGRFQTVNLSERQLAGLFELGPSARAGYAIWLFDLHDVRVRSVLFEVGNE